jgi:hypothetical protein
LVFQALVAAAPAYLMTAAMTGTFLTKSSIFIGK